jgi:hypothetical protein
MSVGVPNAQGRVLGTGDEHGQDGVEADSLQIGKKYITFFYEQTETL